MQPGDDRRGSRDGQPRGPEPASASGVASSAASREERRELDVHEALFTTRMMRRVHLDPIVLETQARILDVAIQAPNGGNTQH